MSRLSALAALAPVVLLAAGAAVFPSHLGAQAPAAHPQPERPPRSLGQPPRYPLHVAGGALHATHGTAGQAVAGVQRSLMNPVTGLAGISAEAYGTVGGPWQGAGVRAMAGVPALGVSGGIDWHFQDTRADVILSFRSAVRRGGIVGHGSMVRVDWLPTRGRAVQVGIQLPIVQPAAGETRRRSTTARYPESRQPASDAGASRDLAAAARTRVPAAVSQELAAVARAIDAIRTYSDLYHAEAGAELQRAGAWAPAIAAYDRHLQRTFATAARVVDGEALASRARTGVLDHVLLPYNTLFGQVKRTAGIRELTTRTHSSFAQWLRDSSATSPAVHGAILAAHAQWLVMIEGVHRRLASRWDDSRSVWLPMPLALTPDGYDEQAEIDSLVARFAGRPFTDGNALTLLRSGDLPMEIARSIYAARDYHVLWMHDFAGVREETRALDLVGYEMVSDVYLPALTAAVRRYDATGRLPLYMVLLDQFFYEPRNGRLWMSILEDPLHASTRLPGDNAGREAHLRQRQQELRAAVAASARLQRDAAAAGDDWLRRTVKVHVSVTQPSDFSFRSHHTIPPIPFTPDNVIRDHRKIAIYDLNEANPYGGAMFLMGVGIGEHYASDTWEDRGYRVRGPAALEARSALWQLLRRHGFAADEIPPALREVTDGTAAEARSDRGDYVGRAIQVHNAVGAGSKHSSVVRALLYDVAAPGSVIIVPDPLWASAEWAGMLAGAAARGAQVHIVAPAKENAPSAQPPLLAIVHEVVSRLVALQPIVAGAGAGGTLRVGLFAADASTDDARGRREEVRAGLERAPWIREVIPFDAHALAVLERAEAVAASAPDATQLADDEEPRPQQLHQKTQLIARPGAIAAFVRQPGWEDALAAALVTQERRTARLAEELEYTTPDVDEEALQAADALLQGFERGIPEAERKRTSFYFSLGTQNQDPRGIMFDGEATLLVSGVPAAAGLVDLFYLMARTRWVNSQSEVDALLPPPSAFMRWLGRIIRPAL